MVRSDDRQESAICEFDPSGSSLAVATPDGLVKAFDTGTGRLKLSFSSRDGTRGVGLREPTTAVAWAPLPGQEENGSAQSMLVTGSAAGAVHSFNCLTGLELWRVPEAHEGPVESAAYINGHIYSCGVDDKLNAIDPGSGRVENTFTNEAVSTARQIRQANGGQNVLLAGSELFLCAADLQRQIRWFSGHPMQASVVATDGGGNFAVSTSPGERAVAVWELKPKKKKMQLPAAASLPVEQSPGHAAVCTLSAPDGSTVVYVAAGDESSAHVWQCFPQSGQRMRSELRAAFRLQTREQEAQSDGILAVHLEPTAKGVSLLLARGTTLKPHFQRFPVSSRGFEELQLEPLEGGALIPGKKDRFATKAAEPRPVTVSANAMLPNGGLDDGQQPISSKKRAAERDPDEAAAALAMEIQEVDAELGGEDEEEEEGGGRGDLTLGERVKALRLRLEEGPSTAAETSSASGGPSRNKADNLATTLTQALRSSDKALIERCISTANDAVVNKTVAGLSAVDATTLLEVAVGKLSSRTSRAHQLVVWIKAVLLRHTAALMAQPGQQQTLAALHQIIESRLQLQEPLTMLLGRLDLLLAQIPSEGLPEAPELRRGPVVHVVSARDEEDVDVEDPFAAEAESSGDEMVSGEEGGDSEMEPSEDEQ